MIKREDFIQNDVIVDGTPLYVLFNTDTSFTLKDSNFYTQEIYGALENGAKVFLEIRNVLLDFCVQLQTNHVLFESEQIKNIISPYGCSHTEVIKSKPFNEYSYIEYSYLVCYMKSFSGREKAIEQIRKLSSFDIVDARLARAYGIMTNIDVVKEKYKTGNDESKKGDMIYKLARKYNLSLTSWNVITKYTLVGYVDNIFHIRCSIEDIYYAPQNPNRMAISYQYRSINGTIPHNQENIDKQRILIMYFDIETHTTRTSNIVTTSRELPLPEYDTDTVFLVSCVFFWSNQYDVNDEPIAKVSIFNTYGKFQSAHQTAIYVNSEEELLKSFIEVVSNMRPDIISGFNSANYDFPFLVRKMIKYDLYVPFHNACSCKITYKYNKSPEFLIRSTFRHQRMKIKADTYAEGYVVEIPGIICVDTMQLLRRLYPDDEQYSLNHFLHVLNLGAKEDMSYHRLFTIIDTIKELDGELTDQLQIDIRDLIVYCEADAALCYKLWAKENIITKYRSRAEMSFVDLKHALNRADATKVINMVIANSPHLVFTHVQTSQIFEGKFTGAYVVDPKVRGLYTEKPVEELDVVSLYPSIIRAYNLSSEMISRDASLMNLLLNRKLIKARELNIPVGDTIEKGWVVFHENDDSKKGVYIKILEYLMDKRAQLKKNLKALKAKIDTMHEDTYEKREMCYKYQVLDSDQLTTKIFMNTFYGITGDKNGIFYEILVAASITYFGQELLKSAHVLTNQLGYSIIYGDTDSIYVAAPDEVFKDMIQGNYTEMCIRSRKAGDELRDKLNLLFKELTYTENIKLSHDTTGFPSFWACKKKYCYLVQEFTKDKPPRFNPEEFDEENYKIKGLTIVTRGQTQLLYDTGRNILLETLRTEVSNEYKEISYIFDGRNISIGNIENVIEYDYLGVRIVDEEHPMVIKNDLMFYTVNKKLREIFNTKFDMDSFIESAAYRPQKKNPKVNRFVERLRERNLVIPNPGERFKFIVTKPLKYTKVNGNFIKYKVGDMMEYVDYAKENGLEINLPHYLSGSLNGMLSRFLSYLFASNVYKEYNEDDMKVREVAMMKGASKLVDALIEYYSGTKEMKDKEQKRVKEEYKWKINEFKEIFNDYYGEDAFSNLKRVKAFWNKIHKASSKKTNDEESENEEEYVITPITLSVNDKLSKIWSNIPDIALNAEYKKRLVSFTSQPLEILKKIDLSCELFNMTNKSRIGSLCIEYVTKLHSFDNAYNLYYIDYDTVLYNDDVIELYENVNIVIDEYKELMEVIQELKLFKEQLIYLESLKDK